VSGGFSGAELIAICREAALFAIEEDDALIVDSSPHCPPQIRMKHLLRAAKDMQHQVTPEMLDFYANYAKTRGVQGG
jgi:transitional endoplasmic reticulum ATPase/AAA family ATPase